MVQITEVRIKLMDKSDDRLRAFCSITLDHCFVVRDLKIIEGNNGPFVAMPSRKLTNHCRNCNMKNHMRARFCNQCGGRLSSEPVDTDDSGRAKLYADIAHPINAECRELIQSRVIEEFEQEIERAKTPGYVSRYDEDYSEPAQRPDLIRADSPQTIAGPHRQAEESPVGQPVTPSQPPSSEAASPPEHTSARNPESSKGRDDQPRGPSGDFGCGLF